MKIGGVAEAVVTCLATTSEDFGIILSQRRRRVCTPPD